MTNFWPEKKFHVFPIFAHFCSFSRISRFASEKTQKKNRILQPGHTGLGALTWPQFLANSGRGSAQISKKWATIEKVSIFSRIQIWSRGVELQPNVQVWRRTVEKYFLLLLYCAPLRRALWLGLRLSDFRPGRSKISKKMWKGWKVDQHEVHLSSSAKKVGRFYSFLIF